MFDDKHAVAQRRGPAAASSGAASVMLRPLTVCTALSPQPQVLEGASSGDGARALFHVAVADRMFDISRASAARSEQLSVEEDGELLAQLDLAGAPSMHPRAPPGRARWSPRPPGGG